MENYLIRKAEIKDYARLIELFYEFAEFEKTPDAMTNTVDQMELEQKHFNALIVEAQNEIIGYVAYFVCYHTWIGKTLFMDDLYIQPQHRGSGLGSILVDRMINLAKEEGCHKLKWQVSRWNEPAISFYKKLGADITDGEMDCNLYFNP